MAGIISWWALLVIIGAGFMPLTTCIFRKFSDRGWIFSKMIGLAVSGWLLWCLTVCGITPFSGAAAIVIFLVLAALCYGLYFICRSLSADASGGGASPSAGRSTGRNTSAALREIFSGNLRLIIAEEALLLGLMLLALYAIGFKPEAYGTEKFMDYAFLTAMTRSTVLPFEDMWLSGEAVNYYYGGQYYAAFLMKMTGVTPGLAYNLMRALITALSFVLPFSLVFQMVRDRVEAVSPAKKGSASGEERKEPSRTGEGADLRTEKTGDSLQAGEAEKKGSCSVFPALGGIFAGLAVAFAGNGHYVIYGIIKPYLAKMRGEDYSYWFPSSTRFIGYDPDVPDKTIHEFPAYSSMLGDLHAHYINLIFVITIAAVSYAWAQKQRAAGAGKPGHFTSAGKGGKKGAAETFTKTVFAPEILLIGLFTGIFRWTNAADFAIFYVVCGSILFFVNLRVYGVLRPGRGTDGRALETRLSRGAAVRNFVLYMLAEAVVAFAAGYAAALPFTLKFTEFTQGIHKTSTHTPLWQLAILWGMPVLILLLFVIGLIRDRIGQRQPSGLMPVPDLTALMLGLCAAGLVLLPELVYVKDIYTDSHYRANTMFKLTYAAYILFGIMMGYVLVRGLMGKKLAKVLSVIGCAMLLLMTGYTWTSIPRWMSGFPNPENYVSADASVFVYQSFPDDFGAISYLNTEVAGVHTILEAPGTSYTGYERVSVATGLPTVAGWYVHEWLWRGTFETIEQRTQDVELIYTSQDTGTVRSFLDSYDVEYLYIGTLEHEKYPDMNVDLLKGMGQVVYEDEGACIVRVG